jgi:hypothetical protein
MFLREQRRFVFDLEHVDREGALDQLCPRDRRLAVAAWGWASAMLPEAALETARAVERGRVERGQILVRE